MYSTFQCPSYPIPSNLIQSYPIPSYPIPSYPIQSYPLQSYYPFPNPPLLLPCSAGAGSALIHPYLDENVQSSQGESPSGMTLSVSPGGESTSRYGSPSGMTLSVSPGGEPLTRSTTVYSYKYNPAFLWDPVVSDESYCKKLLNLVGFLTF